MTGAFSAAMSVLEQIKRGRKPKFNGLADKSVAIKRKPKFKNSSSTILTMSGGASSDEFDAEDSPDKDADIRTLLLSLKRSQCTKNDMKLLTDSVNSKLVQIDAKISKHDGSIAKIDERLWKCEKIAASAQHNIELEKQRSIKNNVSIFGIPSIEGENLQKIVLSLFEKTGCEVAENQVVNRFRIKTKGKGIIIVKLCDYDVKLNILKKKADKTVTVGEIISCDSKTSSEIIYINNHVTPHFGKLLQEGRKARKNGDIHSCWLNAYGCQLKFDEDGKIHMYQTIDEMNKLISDNVSQLKKNTLKRGADNRSPANNKLKAKKN